MSFSLAELIDAAGQAANSGRWHEAGLIWQEVARQEPNNPKAIFGLAVHAFQNGELTRARDLLIAAHQAAPTDILVLLTLGTVYRERGEEKAERDAIETALAIDPYFIPALLARASWLERFGTEVPGAHQHAAGRSDQRKHVAGLHDVGGAGPRCRRNADRMGAVGRRYAGRDTLGRFDRRCEVGAMHGAIARNHRRQVEQRSVLGRDRHANEAASEARHEIDGFGRYEISREDKVAFVLAIFLIDQHDHPPRFEFGDDFRRGCKCHGEFPEGWPVAPAMAGVERGSGREIILQDSLPPPRQSARPSSGNGCCYPKAAPDPAHTAPTSINLRERAWQSWLHAVSRRRTFRPCARGTTTHKARAGKRA